MGFSIRTFRLDEDGELRRFSNARFQRLTRHDPGESLPECAGAHARFAVAYVRTLDGEPSHLEHVDYIRLEIGPDGRLDQEAERRHLRLAAESVALPALSPRPASVIDARHLFHRRQYELEFSWRPSPAQERKLARLIVEQWRKGPRR